MKKIIALCLCAAMVMSLLCGCLENTDPYLPTGDALYSEGVTQPSSTQGSTVEQTLRMVYYPDKTLNPYQTADYTNRALFQLMYQGLFHLDEAYTPTPILCAGYTMSHDMKTYTFYLENATFSDGSAVTAQDVAASLNAARSGPVYQGRLSYVTDISATADGAVTVQLSVAYENLPVLLDIPIVKASDVDADQPIGSGPYYLEPRVTGLQLTRRRDWWCDATLCVTASYIPLVEGISSAQIRDEYEFGNVDLVCTDPGSDTYVDFRSDYELWSCESGIFLYLACNEKSAVFSDPALRQALTHAIDRDALVENYYHGFATPATLPASPQWPYYSKSLAAKYDYDPDIFRQVVAQALPQPEPDENGEIPDPVTVTILVNKADNRRVRVARAIAQMLTDCGLAATTSELSGNAYTNALKRSDYDLHLGQTVLSPNMDLSAFFSKNGSLNYGGMANASIAVMCQSALENSGNYATLHKMVMEDGVLCPILFRSYAIYTTRGVFAELTPIRDQLFYYSLGKTLEDIYIPE